jgi:hypothetical protein
MMVAKKKTPIKKKVAAQKPPKAESPAFTVSSYNRDEFRQPSKKIGKSQKFQLDLIARTNFNLCNGKRVAELLRENRKMWLSAYMPLDAISLRDMDTGSWHADTLYIYAADGWQHSLEELVREQFEADEVHWIGGSSAANMLGISPLKRTSNVILSVWWD